MSLTRRFLTALGIENDKIEEIITAHTEVTSSLKEERDKYKAEAEKLPEVQKELDDLKANTPDNSEELEKLKADYAKLQKESEDFKNAIEAKEARTKKETAFKELLKKTGVSEKRLDTIVKVSDIDGLELDENGAIKDSDKMVESIKNEWSDFIVSVDVGGAKPANPPSNNGGSETQSRASALFQKHSQELYGNTVNSKEE